MLSFGDLFDRLYIKLCDTVVRLHIRFQHIPVIGPFLYLFVFLSGMEDTNASFCLFLRYLYTDLYPPLSYDRTERIFARAFLPMRFKVFRWIISTFGSWAIPPMLRPIYVSYYGRAKYSSQFILDSLSEKKVSQIIILGAGYDTSAYRMKDQRRLHAKGLEGGLVKVFEVDRKEVQRVKLAAMRAHLSKEEFGAMTEGVVFVECDFEIDSLSGTLIRHGADPKLSTAILWEGVTYYLSREALENTIQELHTLFHGDRCVHSSPSVTNLDDKDFELSNESTTLSDSSLVSRQDDSVTPPGVHTPTITSRAEVVQPRHYLFMDYMDTSALAKQSNTGTFRVVKDLAVSLKSPFQTGLDSTILIEQLSKLGLSVCSMKSAHELSFEIKSGLMKMQKMPELVRSPSCDDECLNIVECELM